QQGLAHFWEHLAFKGTQKRSNIQIINRLEVVGGELNAYTTKEKICFHASILTDYYERALDLLVDISFQSVFPEKEINKERNVILEEMAMYNDSPEDSIQDDFDEMIFDNHQLGKNILGNQESVKGFGKSDLEAFINENIDTERIVFSSIGNFSHKQVAKLVNKYFEKIPSKRSKKVRTAPTEYIAKSKIILKDNAQAHVTIGRPAFSLTDSKRLPFFMLTNLLGGAGMNSKLNLAIREKNALVYSIDAGYTPYVDSGFFGIYFGTEQRQISKVKYLIYKELDKLKGVNLSSKQLQNTKDQLMGQMAISEESNMSFMLMMAKSLLDLNKIESLEEIFIKINNVTSQVLRDLANEMYQEKDFSTLEYHQIK
ncbi:MAG: insulinase family protein, partial [Pseudarcicella sp.]|nr:insulinase family protein [Pseudarcicella sp.]